MIFWTQKKTLYSISYNLFNNKATKKLDNISKKLHKKRNVPGKVVDWVVVDGSKKTKT